MILAWASTQARRCRPRACGGGRASSRAASDLVERAVWMRSRRSTRLTRTVETSSRWDSISLATRRLALLERVEPLGRRGRVGLGVLDDVHDLRVLARDALHELGAGQQVGEAVGLEHDGDRVRRVGLVQLDQPRGERAAHDQQPCPQPRQPRALLAQLALDLRELAALGVEARLQLLLAAGELRDVGLQRVDATRLAGDVARQHPLLGLVAADQRVVAIDLALDLARRLVRRRADRQQRPENEREARDQDEQRDAKPHAAEHARQPVCRRVHGLLHGAGLSAGLNVDKARARACQNLSRDAQTHLLWQRHRTAGPDDRDHVPAGTGLRRPRRHDARRRCQRVVRRADRRRPRRGQPLRVRQARARRRWAPAS